MSFFISRLALYFAVDSTALSNTDLVSFGVALALVSARLFLSASTLEVAVFVRSLTLSNTAFLVIPRVFSIFVTASSVAPLRVVLRVDFLSGVGDSVRAAEVSVISACDFLIISFCSSVLL